MIQAGMEALSEREKLKLCEWIRAILLLDNEEWECFAGLAPMTQAMFYRCMKKCTEHDNDTAVFYLMEKYPNHLWSFVEQMEAELKLMDIDDGFLQKTQMYRAIWRRQLMRTIREEYGCDGFGKASRRSGRRRMIANRGKRT